MGFFLFFLGLIFLSGCAAIDSGVVDQKGRNGFERSVQEALGLELNEDSLEVAQVQPQELIEKPAEKSNEMTAEKSIESPPNQVAAIPSAEKSAEPIAHDEPKPSEMLAEAREAPESVPVPAAPALAPVPESTSNFSPDEITPRFPEAKKPQEAIQKYKKEAEDESPVIPSKASGNSSAGASLALKEKYPGIIIYTMNDASFQTISEMKLQEIANRLLKNPSENVLFQAQMGEGENLNLVKLRFDSVKNRLVRKYNLSPERITLDEKQLVGELPELKIYILRF